MVNQLKRAESFLQKYFGSFLRGWKIILCAYFHECDPKYHFCDDCKPFVLTEKTDFVQWWKDQNDFYGSSMDLAQSDNELFKFLIFSQHMHKEPVTKRDIVDQFHNTISSKVGTPINILLWNRQQLSTLNSAEDLKLIITGPFGSGKTILLKEKAIQVAKKIRNEAPLEKGKTKKVHFLILRQRFAYKR